MVKLQNDQLQKVYEIFRLAGMITAKSISDDRLVDLPFSPIFWDLVLGKVRNIKLLTTLFYIIEDEHFRLGEARP